MFKVRTKKFRTKFRVPSYSWTFSPSSIFIRFNAGAGLEVQRWACHLPACAARWKLLTSITVFSFRRFLNLFKFGNFYKCQKLPFAMDYKSSFSSKNNARPNLCYLLRFVIVNHICIQHEELIHCL